MSLSNSRNAYLDCFTQLDAAMAQPRGIRIELPSFRAANHFRMRIHQARAIDRSDNAKTYPAEHPLHGRSPYDIFVCRIEGEGPCWLYLDREKVQIGAVEPIPEGYHIAEVASPKAVLQIEYKPNVEAAMKQAMQQPQIRRR